MNYSYTITTPIYFLIITLNCSRLNHIPNKKRIWKEQVRFNLLLDIQYLVLTGVGLQLRDAAHGFPCGCVDHLDEKLNK